MFRIIFAKEIRQHLMTFRFAALLITLLVLVNTSVGILGGDYKTRLHAFNTLKEDYNSRMRTTAVVPSRVNPVLTRQPLPLRIFAEGEDRRNGNVVVINRHQFPRKASDSLTSNEIMESLPSFDLYTILAVIVSLFGLLISYDSINGEKQQGTLKLLCTGRVRRSTLFLAKAASRFTLVSVAIILSVLTGVLVLSVLHDIAFTVDEAAGAALIVAVCLLYSYTFIAAGMLCSALTRSPSTGLIFALLIWVTLVYLVPISGEKAAELFIQLSPEDEIREMEKAETEAVDAKALAYLEKLTAEHQGDQIRVHSLSMYPGTPFIGNASPGGFQLYGEFFRYREDLYQEKSDRIRNLVLSHERMQRRQMNLAYWFSVLSPATHLRLAMTGVARTGSRDYAQFIDEARTYHAMFMNLLRSKGYFSSRFLEFVSTLTTAEALSQTDYERRMQKGDGPPEMEPMADSLFRELVPEFRSSLSHPAPEKALLPILILFMMLSVVFSAGLMAFNRYDVR